MNNRTVVMKSVEWSNKMLAVFGVVVNKLNLTDEVITKFPKLLSNTHPETITLGLSVIIGLIVVLGIYGILINISKFTLNFIVFTKWAVIAIFLGGIAINLIG